MNIDRAVLLLAGSMVMAGVVLAVTISNWWLLLPAFVGLNLVQSSFTGFCPAAMLLGRAGLTAGCAFPVTKK